MSQLFCWGGRVGFIPAVSWVCSPGILLAQITHSWHLVPSWFWWLHPPRFALGPLWAGCARLGR